MIKFPIAVCVTRSEAHPPRPTRSPFTATTETAAHIGCETIILFVCFQGTTKLFPKGGN